MDTSLSRARGMGIFNQVLHKQEIVARLFSLSPSSSPLSAALLYLTDAQAEENYKMRWAFRSFIFLRCSAAMRLANYPAIRNTVGYPTVSLRLSLLLLFSDVRFYLSLSFTHIYMYVLFLAYTFIHLYAKPLFFLLRATLFVSSRYKFIPLTFSVFLPSVSLHFQSTTVLDNASIRF